ncbi:hypothetical protein H072_8138 [Dactylellina haptotyla CBS 200.50]|uniref:Extracellular serine-rich protein n=1 Tax=Dactylellina haptotyla (strain CBS 200.50) TaxID=1284197 RepID=S8AAG4_DACHA|nr:hypothetical protein H072_8138 [Dactylellina haptotyla CBS 200.50]
MDRILSTLSSIIYSQLLPLMGQLQTKSAGVSSTATKLTTTTSARISTTTTPATNKASVTSATSTVPASSVRSTTSTGSARSAGGSSSAPTASSGSSIVVSSSTTPNTDQAISSISQSTSISPVATDNIPNIENQQLASSSIGPPPSAPSISSASVASTSAAPTPFSAFTLLNNVLILAPDSGTAELTEDPLEGYGMAWETLIVPQAGITLPALNTTNKDGSITCNYNIIVVHSQLSYNYGTDLGWRSALTTAQWSQLYAYQLMCNVRMVHFNVWPSSAAFGADALGGCCNNGDDQNVTIVANVATARFPTAGLKAVPLSMTGLYHVPSKITDTNTTQTTEFLQFSPNIAYSGTTTGGVINTYPDGRSQMVFFLSFGTWSPTSAYLNHIWIHWATHGLYDGYRRALLSSQIDDVLLDTDLYSPAGSTYRLTVPDLTAHALWVADLNERLVKTNPGSSYFIELGINGNGNLLQANTIDPNEKTCKLDPIWYAKDPDTTPLEFQKALGTGTDSWPSDANNFSIYPLKCFKLDPLSVYLWSASKTSTAFSYVSHTFTHLSLNNATYNDTWREINWNLQYFKLSGLDQSSRMSLGGIIPPAITGMHNGDALSAMSVNGVWNAVGDNTRPVLRNPNSPFWPLNTTVADNGFAGFQITPRWATRIYFNCDTADCTVAEWQATSASTGDINDLLAAEKESTTNYLLSLMHDPYMFHQANLRTTVNNTVTILGTGLSSNYSLLQMWVETQVNEFQRLVSWPLLTVKHDDIATSFKNRYLRDQCNALIKQSIVNGKVVAVTVTADGNKCAAEVPVTIPGGIKESGTNIRTEQIGNDPVTVWVTLNGLPVTLTLKSSLAVSGL